MTKTDHLPHVFRYELEDGAAYLTLSAPDKVNALNARLVEQLGDGVRRARRDHARVVVVRAEGHAFCVGGDLATICAADENDIEDLVEAGDRVISDLHRMDAIVVSVVSGVAAGAGVALAVAADLVLAAESARFTVAYTKVGLTPDCGTSLLVNSIGLHRALHLALLNPRLTARQAEQIGLVAQVHADTELDAAVGHLVADLLAGSRTAQVATKRLLRDVAAPRPEGMMRAESLALQAAATTPDGRERPAAFLAKRRPRFPSTLQPTPPAAERKPTCQR